MKDSLSIPKHLIIYFQVHQPKRLRPFSFFDIGSGKSYFDDEVNGELMRRVALLCYRPANHLLLSLIQKHPNIRIAYSISGVALEQMEKFAPVVLDDFRLLAETGAVEFLSETYYHSLASMISQEEFVKQIRMHRNKIFNLIGARTAILRNTELIYSDRIGEMAQGFGFDGMLAEGHPRLLGAKSSHHLYTHPHDHLKLLFRDYRLSDDIAFRFSQKEWEHYPLTASKYMSWIESLPAGQNLVTLGLDYETFGEHQKLGSGIFKFLEELMNDLSESKEIKMVSPSEAISKIEPWGSISVPEPKSWADGERDLSPWLGNEMQRDAFENLKRVGRKVKQSASSAALDAWRNLQTSDHFYYMSTKSGDDGAVHNYFSAYSSAHEAFLNYMNVLNDLDLALSQSFNQSKLKKRINSQQHKPNAYVEKIEL